jgi:hypothetical protein
MAEMVSSNPYLKPVGKLALDSGSNLSDPLFATWIESFGD